MSEFRPIISIILTIVLVLALVGVVQVLKKGIYEHGDDIYFVDEDGVGSSGGRGKDGKGCACWGGDGGGASNSKDGHIDIVGGLGNSPGEDD